MGFGCLMVGTEHSADLGINWHLSVLREKGQIMMLLYCHFPESSICRALTPRVPPVFISPTSPHGFMLTSSFQKIISTSLMLTENKLGEVASKERMHRKKIGRIIISLANEAFFSKDL